jgi:hypothetical protein
MLLATLGAAEAERDEEDEGNDEEGCFLGCGLAGRELEFDDDCLWSGVWWTTASIGEKFREKKRNYGNLISFQCVGT